MNNLFLDNLKEEIKKTVSMDDVCHLLNIEVNQRGFAKCPFHGDSKPSMKVYPASRGYYCFVCNHGGDVIGFVKEYLRISTVDAMRYLCSNFGIPFEGELDSSAKEQAERRKREQEAQLAKKKDALDEYHHWLDKFILYDSAIRVYAPNPSVKSIDELNPFYITAQKKIEYARYRLELAEMKLHGHG